MPREREAGYHGLTSIVVFKALDLISGHSRPLDERPTPRRRYTSATGHEQARAEALPVKKVVTNWPGIEAPVDFPRLPPRTHCVTPPPLDAAVELSKSPERTESPLFRLSPELLLLIYENVIGNRVLHIVRRNEKLGHATCKVNKRQGCEDCKEENCRGLKLPTGMYVKSEPGQSDILPLLQTCRRVYADAIEVLYTSNTFDFDSMESFISFSTAILPKRFDSIQYLQLEFRFSMSFYFSESTATNDPPRWERTWRVVGSMKSLQKLWVWISWHRSNFGPVEEGRLLEQLDQVRQLEKFEVSLPTLKGSRPRVKGVERVYEQLFEIHRRC